GPERSSAGGPGRRSCLPGAEMKRAAKAALAARTRHVLLASFEAGRPGACASGSSRFESPRARPRAWSYGLGGAPAVLALSCGSLLGDVEITGHEQEQQQEEEAP